jgi:hypothetical protein
MCSRRSDLGSTGPTDAAETRGIVLSAIVPPDRYPRLLDVVLDGIRV